MASFLKSDSHNQVYRGNVLSQVESDIYNQIEMTEPPESDIHNRIEITESTGRIKMTEPLKSDGHSRIGAKVSSQVRRGAVAIAQSRLRERDRRSQSSRTDVAPRDPTLQL